MVVFIVNVKTLAVGAETSNRQYVGSLPVPLLVNAIWALVWWAIWTNQAPEANNDGGYRIWSPTDKTVRENTLLVISGEVYSFSFCSSIVLCIDLLSSALFR